VSAPHPRPDPVAGDDALFWHYVARGQLRLQRCTECAKFRHPPRPVCARCGSSRSEWVPASGGGEVWTYTVVHPPTLPAFADRVPYGAVVVRLDEDVFMVSNLVDCPVEELTVGQRVEVAITEVDDGVVLALFRRV
jgi:3-oxo-4,17-pregnadiene-20-carboxyl-CoA hydratase alpha subunit